MLYFSFSPYNKLFTRCTFTKHTQEYFYIPHWKKERGVGGIFFDHFNTGNFDRDLRMLTMNAIERLEIAIRSIITSRASLFYHSPHWYLDGTVVVLDCANCWCVAGSHHQQVARERFLKSAFSR